MRKHRIAIAIVALIAILASGGYIMEQYKDSKVEIVRIESDLIQGGEKLDIEELPLRYYAVNPNVDGGSSTYIIGNNLVTNLNGGEAPDCLGQGINAAKQMNRMMYEISVKSSFDLTTKNIYLDGELLNIDISKIRVLPDQYVITTKFPISSGEHNLLFVDYEGNSLNVPFTFEIRKNLIYTPEFRDGILAVAINASDAPEFMLDDQIIQPFEDFINGDNLHVYRVDTSYLEVGKHSFYIVCGQEEVLWEFRLD